MLNVRRQMPDGTYLWLGIGRAVLTGIPVGGKGGAAGTRKPMGASPTVSLNRSQRGKGLVR